jgi:hypothetical protein
MKIRDTPLSQHLKLAIGGITLHHGKIAEMRTGEGKTLVATLTADPGPLMRFCTRNADCSSLAKRLKPFDVALQ